MKKKFSIICLVMLVLFSLAACGKQEPEEEEIERIQNGPVDSPDAFIQLGFYIDVVSDTNITNKSCEIVRDEIAVMKFIYNGLTCELRGSTIYSDYDLAEIPNTMDGNVVIERVGNCIASVYTLNPGRIIFWDDGQINYSLYIYVTADDTVVRGILSDIVCENHYAERADVIQNTEDAKIDFAYQIIAAMQNKDLGVLSNMLYYPQQLGGGQSAGNAKEFQSLPPEEIFTDLLLKEMKESAVLELRLTPDETEYLLGSNQKNVHFKQMEDGSFKITKINN